MPLFDNTKATKKSLRDIPEGTTEKPKKGPGIVQWIKNSGHSVKGVFLEWLSEQQLFTVVNDEIKMIKKEHKKKKMSPQEKKNFKQKVAALSDDAIKKFGELYLGTNSSQEAKDKIKEGIQTVLGQIKSGNFYHKANAFGDDEFDAFMDDLEDEWEDDQEASGEVFMLNDIINKHGFGEIVNLSKYNVSIKPIGEKAKLDKIIYRSGFGEFMKPGKPKFQQEDIDDVDGSNISIFLYYPKGETEINDLQKSILADLKDPKERTKVNKEAKKQLMKKGGLDEDDYTIKYDKITSFEVTPDGVISGTAYGWFTSKYNPDQKPTYDEIGYDVEITSYEEKKPQGEFMKPGNKNTVTWDLDIENEESLEVEFTLSRNQKEPNELQKKIFEQLKDPKVRKELNDYARSKSSTESDDGEYNTKFKLIHFFQIRQDGMMFVDTSGYYTNKKVPLDYYFEEIDHMIPISKFKGGK